MDTVSLITIRVSDIDRALRFYRDQLGLPHAYTDGTFHEFATGGAQLALDTGGMGSGPKGPDRCPVEIHLRVEDIEAVRTTLEAKGISFAGPTEEHSFGKFARLHDPDGNPLILFQQGACPLQAAPNSVAIAESG